MNALFRFFLYSCRAFSYGLRFYGKNIFVHPTAKVSWKAIIRTSASKDYIRIGKYCEIHPYAILESRGGFVSLGSNCSVNPFTVIYGHGGVCIKDDVRIATGCTIVAANHIYDSLSLIRTSGITAVGINVSSNCWLATRCVLLDGVSLPENSVCAAGAIITKSPPSASLLAGVPAKIIKPLRPL